MTPLEPLDTPLSDPEKATLRAGGFDPDTWPVLSWDSLAAPEVSGPDPNIWPEERVRDYLGFPQADECADDDFDEFAEALLVETRLDASGRRYFAEQFACGSVIPGVRALWDRFPTCDWEDFAAWLAGSSPETSSSRRDFLMAGGDFMRVWREVSAMHEGWPDGWPDGEE